MTQLQLLNDLGNILAQVVFWVCFAFVLVVSTYWAWWKADFGWTIMLKIACLAAVLLPFNLQLLLGINVMTYFWRWEVVVTFALVAVTIVWRAFVIWQLQHRSKEKDRPIS